MRRGRPEPIRDLLPRVLDDLGLDSTSIAIRLLQVWDDVVGSEVGQHCRCDGLRRGVVHAVVRDSAWMQRVQMEIPRILDALHESFDADQVRGLRLHIGPVDE